VTTEKKQLSSYRLAELYVVIIIGFTVSNVFLSSASWSMFSISLGWCLAIFTVLLPYVFTEQMRAFPWFWNTILVSDVRILAVAEMFGLGGCVVSVLLAPSEVVMIIGLSAVSALLMVPLVYILRPR
jgi:hypothetical protein